MGLWSLFSSQQQFQGSHALFWPPCAPGTHTVHIYACSHLHIHVKYLGLCVHMMVKWGACEPQCACGVGSLLPPSCKSQRSHEVRLAVRAPFLAEPHLLLSPEVLRLSPHTYIKALCTDDTVTEDQELLDYRIMSTGENPRPETRPWAVTPPPSMHRFLQSQFTGEKDISAPCPSLTQLTHYPWRVDLLVEVLSSL